MTLKDAKYKGVVENVFYLVGWLDYIEILEVNYSKLPKVIWHKGGYVSC